MKRVSKMKIYFCEKAQKQIKTDEIINKTSTSITVKIEDAQFCIINFDNECYQQYLKKLECSKTPFITLSSLENQENVEKILLPYKINHLVSLTPRSENEIISIIKNYQSSEFWTINDYLQPDTIIQVANLESSTSTHDVFNHMVSKINLSHFFESPLDFLKLMANEMITNALKYSAEFQHVVVSIGADSNLIAMSVKDQNGGLSKSAVITSLARAYRDKSPRKQDGHDDFQRKGAGLGLYLIYYYSNQLIVKSRPGKSCEVIVLIEASKRYLNYQKRNTSFHYFQIDTRKNIC